jgi:WD repeat-containing protein mio
VTSFNFFFRRSYQQLVARIFNRPLSSFALVPNSRHHPLTSEIMLVNKDGDLELYSLHDTPKQTLWSAQGDLTVGAGVSYRIFPGFNEHGFSQNSDGSSPPNAHSAIQLDGVPSPGELAPARIRHEDRLESSNRSIASPRWRSLAIDRSSSPAATHDRQTSEVKSHRDNSRSNATRGAQGTSTGHASNDKSHSRSHKKMKQNAQSLIQDDISMIMRKRVMNGYNLSCVRDSFHILYRYFMTDHSVQPEKNRDLVKTERSNSALVEVWSWLNSTSTLN